MYGNFKIKIKLRVKRPDNDLISTYFHLNTQKKTYSSKKIIKITNVRTNQLFYTPFVFSSRKLLGFFHLRRSLFQQNLFFFLEHLKCLKTDLNNN